MSDAYEWERKRFVTDPDDWKTRHGLHGGFRSVGQNEDCALICACGEILIVSARS